MNFIYLIIFERELNMFNWCRDLCRPKKDKERKKLDKKDKHGQGDKGGKDDPV
jgi:hypothetical protein